jgi:hypothetical protein
MPLGCICMGTSPLHARESLLSVHISAVKDEFLEFDEAASSTEGGSSMHFISRCRTLLTGWKPCRMVLSPLRGNVVH